MNKSTTRACVAACLINLVNLNARSGDTVGAILIGLLAVLAIGMEIAKRVRQERHNDPQ